MILSTITIDVTISNIVVFLTFFFLLSFGIAILFSKIMIFQIPIENEKNQVATPQIPIENEKNQVVTPQILIENKKNQIPSDPVKKTGQVWTHEFFPIIQEVKVTEGMTTQDIIHELNNALTHPNTKSLDELIDNLEKLKGKNETALEEYLKLWDDLNIIALDLDFSYNPADIDALLYQNLLFLELLKLEIYMSLKEIPIDSVNNISQLNSRGWSIKK